MKAILLMVALSGLTACASGRMTTGHADERAMYQTETERRGPVVSGTMGASVTVGSRPRVEATRPGY